MQTQLTTDSEKMFRELIQDALDWDGTPMADVNNRTRGNLTDLKVKGLLYTEQDDENRAIQWVYFTPAGIALAKSYGVDLAWVAYLTEQERTELQTLLGQEQEAPVVEQVVEEAPKALKDKTLQDFVNEVIAKVGGGLHFLCPNYAIVQAADGTLYGVTGPGTGRGWRTAAADNVANLLEVH